MTDKDYAISTVAIPNVGAVSKKPCYLVSLLSATAKGANTLFVAMDKPDWINGFIQVKGFYCSDSEDVIVPNFGELVRNTPKEDIIEIYFPWHRIHSIRSLVFNALKPSTLLNK